MAATGPAVTLLCRSFRASQQTKPNVSSATPASCPTSDPERVPRGEPIRTEISTDGEAASAKPVAASSSAVTLSNVFIKVSDPPVYWDQIVKPSPPRFGKTDFS